MGGRLDQQVAIVTGGSSGIGRAVSIALAREGVRLVVVGRDPAKIDATLDLARAENPALQAFGLALDVTQRTDMDLMAAQTLERFGRIDILIASAGCGGGRLSRERNVPFAVVQLPLAEWSEIVDTNLNGVIHSTQAVLPAMIQQRRGQILPVSSSRGATIPLPYAAAYSASKRALTGYLESFSAGVRHLGIRVQTILPDVVETPMMEGTRNLAPHGLMKPEDVANWMVTMLCLPPDTVVINPLIRPFGGNQPGETS
ncbi:MAG TPA: SDR family oxidoreductase [Kiritimatiellia bacterium]|nr:SDR family oxidoreductase [Kiritimatiellia bacterium]